MASGNAQDSTVSAYRAFVVHLGAGVGPGRRFSGRVEHLSSGESIRFTSLKELLAFFTSVLDRAVGAAAGPDRDRSALPSEPR